MCGKDAVVTARDYFGNLIIKLNPTVSDVRASQLAKTIDGLNPRWVYSRLRWHESGGTIHVTLFSCSRPCDPGAGCLEYNTCSKPDARQYYRQLRELITKAGISYDWHEPNGAN